MRKFLCRSGTGLAFALLSPAVFGAQIEDTLTIVGKVPIYVLVAFLIVVSVWVYFMKSRDPRAEPLGKLFEHQEPIHGVGPDTAALLLVAAGDHPERLRSEAAWAHLCAAAPIQASSGKVTRHRLNPGGDRQANHALWRIVITRMSSHPPTRAYVERRTAEGLSKTEIIRCLKRYVARETYPRLRAAAD